MNYETAVKRWAAEKLNLSPDVIKSVEWECWDEGYESTGPDIHIGAKAFLFGGSWVWIMKVGSYSLENLIQDLLEAV